MELLEYRSFTDKVVYTSQPAKLSSFSHIRRSSLVNDGHLQCEMYQDAQAAGAHIY